MWTIIFLLPLLVFDGVLNSDDPTITPATTVATKPTTTTKAAKKAATTTTEASTTTTTEKHDCEKPKPSPLHYDPTITPATTVATKPTTTTKAAKKPATTTTEASKTTTTEKHDCEKPKPSPLHLPVDIDPALEQELLDQVAGAFPVVQQRLPPEVNKNAQPIAAQANVQGFGVTDCKDRISPKGFADCSALSHLCDHKLYSDFMTTYCPKTCRRCHHWGLRDNDLFEHRGEPRHFHHRRHHPSEDASAEKNQDDEDLDCAHHEDLCVHPKYCKFMVRHCPQICEKLFRRRYRAQTRRPYWDSPLGHHRRAIDRHYSGGSRSVHLVINL